MEEGKFIPATLEMWQEWIYLLPFLSHLTLHFTEAATEAAPAEEEETVGYLPRMLL